MGKKDLGILGGGLVGLIAEEPLAAISPLAGYLKNRRDKKKDRRLEREAADADEEQRMQKIMSATGGTGGMDGMKAGGKVKSIDGMAIRGKTKGRMI
jgi:hypothetical protein